MRILVTGATGYIGSRLVGALLADGHDVVVATRNTDKLAAFGWRDKVSAVTLDADSSDSAALAFAEAGAVDLIYYLVHGIGQPDFRARDSEAAANVAQAAKKAGVARIVYLGGFVPDDDTLSDHLASRAEVAEALQVDDGPEVVWLGAAIIVGAGSTSFEMVRYVGDRLPLIPLPSWVDHAIDPISISDVLYYLKAAADSAAVPAGAYDIIGPDSTTYRGLIGGYVNAAGSIRAGLPSSGWPEALVPKSLTAWVAGNVVPVPTGLAIDLIASLDHPMTASGSLLRDIVADPPGGLTPIDDAIAASIASPAPRPVDQLADPHDLADSDASWAGGDALRLRRMMGACAPSIALDLIKVVPKPLAAMARTGLDIVAGFAAKVDPT
ncbi:NAD(P)H-binding protein [soil metagenome]